MESEAVRCFVLWDGAADTDRQEKPDLLEEIAGRQTLISFLVLPERRALGVEDKPEKASS